MLFIDTHNLFHSCLQQHDRMVDYNKLVSYLIDKYSDPFHVRFAYVANKDKSRGFANFLRTMNFIVRSKDIRDGKIDHFDVELTLDVLDREDRRVIICSSSPNLTPLVHALNDNCVSVSVHSCGIPYCLKQICFTEELPRRLLRDGVVAA